MASALPLQCRQTFVASLLIKSIFHMHLVYAVFPRALCEVSTFVVPRELSRANSSETGKENCDR